MKTDNIPDLLTWHLEHDGEPTSEVEAFITDHRRTQEYREHAEAREIDRRRRALRRQYRLERWIPWLGIIGLGLVFGVAGWVLRDL